MSQPAQHAVFFRPVGQVSQNELGDQWFGGVPETEQFRRYFGRNINAGVIEECLRRAQQGYMRDLTDLSYESLALDPHLASVVGKRIRAVGTVTPQVIPATGDGIHAPTAQRFADAVRQNLEWIPNPHRVMQRIAWGLYHGRSLSEKVWGESKGRDAKLKLRIEAVHWIHPRRLSFGPHRELRIRDDLWQWGQFEARGFNTQDAPEKFIGFLPQLFDDYPEREGLASRALYWTWFKRFTWRERLVLLEVYGKPWRVVEQIEGETSRPEDLDIAQAQADRLGANTSAAMPRGLRLAVEQPARGAGQIHKEVTDDVDSQLSKLVLGSTRTTDAAGDGLGGEQSRVHQDSEQMAFVVDCLDIGDVMTEQFSAHLIAMNEGIDAVSHAPRIKLPWEPMPDPEKETQRAKVAVSIGIPLKVDEVYERIGFTRPGPDDAVVQQQAAPAGGPFGAPASNVSITDPKDPAPAPPEAPRDPEITGGETSLARSLTASLRQRSLLGDRICCAAQPETVNGTPETLITGGVNEAARVTLAWADELADAVEDLENPGEIFATLAKASNDLPLNRFARVAERRLLQAVMLGALDSSWEVENERLVDVEAFSVPWSKRVLGKDFAPGDSDKRFAVRPFSEAVKLFREREVVSRDRFEQLTAAAKRRAFTVARLARKELLAVAHAELSRQLETTETSLPSFAKVMRERIESAGWTPANASHVETIFRTNVVGGYSAGRHAQMTEPATLELRPVWQWFAISDDRGRPSHRAAHGTILPANHEFWQRAYPPAGYNCRCRVVSRGKDWADRVTEPPAGLPDAGFTSGAPALLTADL